MDEHSRRSNRAAAAVIRLPAFKTGARIALYLPFDREADTSVLVAEAVRRGIHVFVPAIADPRHRRLRFHPLTGPTRRGAFGISIPSKRARWIAPRWFNLIIVPLVGIDREGRRLGMGGGFYDRALAFRRERRQWRGPRLVGFGFECQRADDVFASAWDVRLDSLATESGMRHFPLPNNPSGEP